MMMEDRISLLPDVLLHHILSTLNTKCVVQTCVLSKRWKTLWTHIPTLNFDYNSYSSSLSSFKDNDDEAKEKSFKYFIFRVLSKHCTTNIHKLTYTTSQNEDELVLVEFLICYAGSRNVQQLCINTYDTIGIYDWNYCFSVCSSLIGLKMVCAFVHDWGVLAIPSLKILEIECDWYERDKEANYKGITMFPGCPNLESLVLVDYLFESSTISAPKLKNLKLCASPRMELTFPEVELFTPTLETVNFINVLPIVKSDSEFSCIHKVDIQLKDSIFERVGSQTQKLKSNFRELLSVFHNARSFTLPLKATLVISLYDELFFHNMSHLRLKTKESGLLLEHLLKAPKLKTFVVLNEDKEDIKNCMG
ncbi:F-box/LRR-repeat protein At3g26922-like [Benincasa hispida]|uniref:F-box/LRR-repeat protein At3g26922-like n=1 Tax=Benincasa hispida TaxID=102211 RepID=UPI0018FFA6BD|nr:F-box/LRR-repeat protein At3g26922-like [Benincasa hispida]